MAEFSIILTFHTFFSILLGFIVALSVWERPNKRGSIIACLVLLGTSLLLLIDTTRSLVSLWG